MKKPRDHMKSIKVYRKGLLKGSFFSICILLGVPNVLQASGDPKHPKFLTGSVTYHNPFLQEQVQLEGIVYDEKKQPLSGATLKVKGIANLATQTNKDGRFSIKVPLNSILIVSHLNHVAKELTVTESNTNLQIILASELSSLDEVLVIGYGTTSTKKNATAIATFDAQSVANLPFSDMGSALQGRIPGVIVQQGSPEPGQNGASISIRGNGAPLYVIDGFISTPQQYFSLNKADIKSMSILKDAASTAVYGMNAGNGVVLVTTKQGELGKFQVNYQANLALNTPSYQTKRMNAYEYATAINNLNQALGQGAFSFKTEAELEEIKNNLDQYTNWEEALTKKYTPQNEHTLSLNGGTDKIRFFGSLNMLDQSGIYKSNSLQYGRYSYRSNVSSTFEKIGLVIDFSVNGFLRKEDYPPASAYTIYSRLRDRNPFEKPYTESGQISNQFDNPALQLNSPGYIRLKTVYNQLSGGATWNTPWIPGLSFGFNGNFNIESQDAVDWVETATYYDEDGNATEEEPSNISVRRYSYMDQRFDVNLRADYRKLFESGHNVEVTLVQNIREYYTNSLSAGSRGFYTTAIKQIQKGDADLITASNGEGKQAWIGYVGRLHYDYKQKYILGFAGRYDGSDNFPENKRWGFFPSVSAGWAISEEGFFKSIKDKSVLNYLKLKGSYGQIGLNDVDHWAYAYLPTYNYNTNGYVVDGKLVNTVSPGPIPSLNMTWYTRTKYDLGIEFDMFNKKVNGGLDWFFETTKGYLAAENSYSYTDPLGYALPTVVSDAEDRIEGVDGYLNYKAKIGKVNFNTGFNFTYYKRFAFKTNEDSVQLANPRLRQQGNYYGYVGTGYVGAQFYQNANDIINNPKRVSSRDLRPGDLWYQDINGDGKIDGQDQTRYGHNTSPTFVFGIDLGANYKGFSVLANIQGTGSRQTYFSNVAMGSEGERRIDFQFQNDNWSPNNPDASMPRPGNASLNDNNNYASSDFWARKTHYVRLKSLTLAYDFKNSLLSNQTWLNNMTLFVSGINLLAFGPSVSYGDPESNNFDGYSYPMMRTYSAGFQIGF